MTFPARLLRDKTLYADMLCGLMTSRLRLLYDGFDGVICFGEYENAVYAAADSLSVVAKAVGFSPSNLILHGGIDADEAGKLFGLNGRFDCVQGVYLPDVPPKVTAPDGIRIDAVGLDRTDEVRANYDVVSDIAYISDVIKRGDMSGAFDGGKLAGFCGIHPDGAIGMLFVKPEYRKRGVGKALFSYKIAEMLTSGGIPYAQHFTGNTLSHSLMQSAGMTFASQTTAWLHN